jgi:hypothetical protein
MKKKLFVAVLLAVLLAALAGCAPGTGVHVDTPVPNKPSGTPVSNDQIKVPGVSIQVNAPGPNPQVNTADARGRVASIVMGLWHGIISPVTLVVSFFNSNVQMYEVHNDGSKYNLGFLLGVAIVFVLLGALIGSRR